MPVNLGHVGIQSTRVFFLSQSPGLPDGALVTLLPSSAMVHTRNPSLLCKLPFHSQARHSGEDTSDTTRLISREFVGKKANLTARMPHSRLWNPSLSHNLAPLLPTGIQPHAGAGQGSLDLLP